MRRVKQPTEDNQFFEDEVLNHSSSVNADLDFEYQEFKEGVLSGKISSWDCKNPFWANMYDKIRKEHSKNLIKEIAVLSCNTTKDNNVFADTIHQPDSNHSDYLKHGEPRDCSPDDFED